MKFQKMSVKEFNTWLKNPESREASLPEFFGKGVKRTRNVLAGTATDASVAKWKSFIARHGAAFEQNPTHRRAIAIQNWGWKNAATKEMVKKHKV
jgi:hypothetical protein